MSTHSLKFVSYNCRGLAYTKRSTATITHIKNSFHANILFLQEKTPDRFTQNLWGQKIGFWSTHSVPNAILIRSAS